MIFQQLKGTQIETTKTTYKLQQLIDEPTHICKNCSSCIIDLIFTNEPNLIVNREIDSSLHENCQHQNNLLGRQKDKSENRTQK